MSLNINLTSNDPELLKTTINSWLNTEEGDYRISSYREENSGNVLKFFTIYGAGMNLSRFPTGLNGNIVFAMMIEWLLNENLNCGKGMIGTFPTYNLIATKIDQEVTEEYYISIERVNLNLKK